MRTGFRLRQTKTGSGNFTKVFATVRKATLRERIIQHLRQELERQTSAAELSRDEATSEESRAENKWDTHSQEAAYLAEGQARQAMEVGQSLEVYGTLVLPDFSPSDAIAVGAVVGLDVGAERGVGQVGRPGRQQHVEDAPERQELGKHDRRPAAGETPDDDP